MSSADLLAELFALAETPELAPRFNIAPTQDAPVVRAGRDGGPPRLDMLRWGLIPWWAKDVTVGARMINARAETAADKPAFREALRRRRCLVPADGFFEWRTTPDGKQPYCFRRADEAPFALAGVYERWRDRAAGEDAPPLRSFSILTTAANELVRPLHDRMPVIVEPEHFDRWLDPETQDPSAVDDLFEPTPAELMIAYPVTRRVNRPENDDASCVEPLAAEETEPEEREPAAGDERQGTLF
jgi:putative SOS response-associated peptidase YedK